MRLSRMENCNVSSSKLCPCSSHHRAHILGALVISSPSVSGHKIFHGHTREITAHDRPTIHHTQIAFGRSGQKVFANGLSQKIVIAKTQKTICAPRFDMREMKIVGTHPVSNKIDPTSFSRFLQSFERTARSERRFNISRIVNQEHIEVINPQNLEAGLLYRQARARLNNRVLHLHIPPTSQHCDNKRAR